MNINRTCLVSKLVSGKNSTAKKCFRTEPDEMTSSGWIFLSGKESRKYINNPYNFKIKKLSHVLASNPDLEPFLDAPIGTSVFLDGKLNKYVAVLDVYEEDMIEEEVYEEEIIEEEVYEEKLAEERLPDAIKSPR